MCLQLNSIGWQGPDNGLALLHQLVHSKLGLLVNLLQDIIGYNLPRFIFEEFGSHFIDPVLQLDTLLVFGRRIMVRHGCFGLVPAKPISQSQMLIIGESEHVAHCRQDAPERVCS
jgi:hypothetical protein